MKINFDEFWKAYDLANDIIFYFESDHKKVIHYVGYIKENDRPYWAGLCDIKDGVSFKDLNELLNAKIYDGKSLKDRWSEVVILEVNGISI